MAETEMKALDMQVAAEEAEDSIALLANDYGIKYESAQQFILLAEDKDTSAVAEKMGIGLLELAPLAKLEMPSAETLDKISKNLGEDRATIENLVVDFIADIQAEDAEAK